VTGEHPIVGPRFHKTGEDYDLCEAEFKKLSLNEKASYDRIDQPRHQMPCRVHRIPLCRFRTRANGVPQCHGLRQCRRPTAAEQERHAVDSATMAPADPAKEKRDPCGSPLGSPPTQLPTPPYAVDTPREEWPKPPRSDRIDQEETTRETPKEVAERAAVEEEATKIAEAATKTAKGREAREAGVAAKCALLIDMGFGEEEVAEALSHTKGSLERAADFLFTRRQEREVEDLASVPPEWAESIDDLVEMGFQERQATEAICEAQGDLKTAIKDLIAAERESSA